MTKKNKNKIKKNVTDSHSTKIALNLHSTSDELAGCYEENGCCEESECCPSFLSTPSAMKCTKLLPVCSDVMISEKNSKGNDFVELYSRDTNACQLTGWGLSDDADEIKHN